MWLAMRGALAPEIREVHRNYYLMTTTAMTVVVYEEGAGQHEDASVAAQAAA